MECYGYIGYESVRIRGMILQVGPPRGPLVFAALQVQGDERSLGYGNVRGLGQWTVVTSLSVEATNEE